MNLPIAILIILFLAGMTIFIFKNGVRMDKLTPEEQETVIRTRCTACRLSRYCNESKLPNASRHCKTETELDLAKKLAD